MDLENYNSYLEVDLGILRENAVKIKRAIEPERIFIPVIKGNAHGFGTEAVAAMFIEDLGTACIACADICEAIKIREAGYKDTVIFLLGGVPFHTLPYAVQYDLQIPLFNKETALRLSKAVAEAGKRSQKVQLKIDVGLHRLGVLPGEPLKELVEYVSTLGNLEISGVYSHFSNPYERNDSITIHQNELFQDSVAQVRAMGVEPEYTHICCSGAATWLQNDRSTHVRIGCMYIGFSPMSDGSNPFGVRQAATWRAFITNICEVKAGDCVGYGTEMRAASPMRTATISIGFCDGLYQPSGAQPRAIIGKRQLQPLHCGMYGSGIHRRYGN